MPVHTTTTQTIAEALTLIYASVTTWNGTVTVRREKDLAGIKDQLPPRDLVTDGVIHLVEPKHLAPPKSRRKEVDRIILKKGFPFMGGYAVRTDCADALLAEIAQIESEFWSDVDHITNNLNSQYDTQETAFPEWKHLIQANRISEVEVKSRYSFSVTPLKLAAPDTAKAKVAFDSSMATVSDAVLASVASAAREMSHKLFFSNRQASITARTINPLVDILAKLESYSFVDARMAPVSQRLTDTLRRFPVNEPFSPHETKVLKKVLDQLAAPDTLLSIGDWLLQEDTPAAVSPQLALPAVRTTVPVPDIEPQPFAAQMPVPTPPSRTTPSFAMTW